MWRKRAGRKINQRRLILEQLENRSVLSGFAFAGATHFHPFHHAAMQPVSSTPQIIAAQSINQSTAGEAHLTATLASGTSAATGTVSYESETEHGQTETKLVVKVAGAAANTPLDVTVTDLSMPAVTTVAGQITTDASGNGTLVLSSDPHGSETSLPAGFPTLATGFAVTVGADLTGTLATSTTEGGGCHGTGGTSETNETKLTAAITHSATGSTLTGSAKYESEQVNGQTVTSFRVNVKGATAAPPVGLDVFIDGVKVGTITPDTSGNGSLYLSSDTSNTKASPLPANFPTVNAGSVVTVGTTATGTLAVPVTVHAAESSDGIG